MKSEYIAKILSTKKDGKRTIGTGYPIAKDLVLTARHVVIFPERDESKPIVIEWTDYNYSDDNVTEIVFDGGEKCDIAILKCKIPPQAQVSSSILAKRFPIEHETWAGFGYPQIGKDEEVGTRKKISVLGKFHPPNATSHEITLTSESDALEKAGWRGVSGAPVFSGTILYAVISSTPTNREECFTAISIPYLLKHDAAFCLALKKSSASDEEIKKQNEKLHEKIKLEIAEIIDSTFEILKKHLKQKEAKTANDIANYLVDKLTVRQSISELTQLLQKHPVQNTNEIKEIVGWLLLKSVDSAWWFYNEQRMRQIAGEFYLEQPDYIEIIISRTFLRPAQYMLADPEKNPEHKKNLYPKPYRDDKETSSFLMIYDASGKATDEALLISLYKDLWEQEPPNADNETLLTQIIEQAEALVLNRRGKLIYYLVTKSYLDILESKKWFKARERLVNCLRFICCSAIEQDKDTACKEGEGSVLAQLDRLLKEIKKAEAKGTSHAEI